MKKWVLRAILAVVIILVIACVAVAFSLDSIVQREVERIGPDATKVDVKLKSAHVSLLAGGLRLTGFSMGNPAGYKMPTSVAADDVSVEVRPATILSDKLVVNTINVKSPLITFEGGLTDNNLKKIEKNLNDYIGTSSTAPNSSAPPSSPAKPERKLQVNDLVITGAKLQVRSSLAGDQTLTLVIPDIHVTQLGTGPQGITPVEVAQRALHEVLMSSAKEIAKNGGEIGKKALENGKNLFKKAGGSLKGVFQQ
jgi:uncharacterized protein involved in outer membrane biogenesis